MACGAIKAGTAALKLSEVEGTFCATGSVMVLGGELIGEVITGGGLKDPGVKAGGDREDGEEAVFRGGGGKLEGVEDGGEVVGGEVGGGWVNTVPAGGGEDGGGRVGGNFCELVLEGGSVWGGV